MSARKRKQSAKAGKPRIVVTRSVKVFGTSSETTRRVSAKPKTASLKDSKRVISRPRRRNPTRSGDSVERGRRIMCEYLSGAERRGKEQADAIYSASLSTLNHQRSTFLMIDIHAVRDLFRQISYEDF